MPQRDGTTSKYVAASDAFGMQERKSEDWFEAGIKEMEPAITAKSTAHLEHKKQPSKETQAAYRAARNNVNRIACKCANDYWLDLCHRIQITSDCGNIRAMYERMKKVFGPSAIKIAPLKFTTGEIITDCGK